MIKMREWFLIALMVSLSFAGNVSAEEQELIESFAVFDSWPSLFSLHGYIAFNISLL